MNFFLRTEFEVRGMGRGQEASEEGKEEKHGEDRW